MRATWRTRSCSLLLVVLLLATGCAGAVKATEVTGESIVALGNTFASTAKGMTDGCISKAFTVAQCDSFRTFGLRFKIAYPLAKDAWNIAATAGDKTKQDAAASALTQLSADLAPFTSIIMGGK